MSHQDWNVITFNTPSLNKKKEENKKIHSNKTNNDPEKFRYEAPKQLGQLLMKARTSKNLTQKDIATQLGISPNIYNKWESNKELPTNAQIASIEKKLNIKLPRNKKVNAKEI